MKKSNEIPQSLGPLMFAGHAYENNMSRYGNYRTEKAYGEGAAPIAEWYIPELLSGSDYSGSLVTLSNRKAFIELLEAESIPDAQWHELHGDYSTRAIALHVDALKNEAVRDFFEGLDQYPLADEELHAELESNAQQEYWNDERSSFARAVENAVYAIDPKSTAAENYKAPNDWRDFEAMGEMVNEGNETGMYFTGIDEAVEAETWRLMNAGKK